MKQIQFSISVQNKLLHLSLATHTQSPALGANDHGLQKQSPAVQQAEPYFESSLASEGLNSREQELITRLLDVCTEFHHMGENHLSEIVDRIGLTLAQAFLNRAKLNEPNSLDLETK